MPLQRSEKEAVVAELAEKLGLAQAIVLADYRGLSVAEFGELRRELRPNGSEIHVVKNSLARRALEQAGYDLVDEWLDGPTAFTFLYEDLSSPTKALLKTGKDTESLTIKGGYLGGKRLDAKSVAALADLPTREELLSQFLALLDAPKRDLVGVLQAPLRDIISVFNARAESEAA